MKHDLAGWSQRYVSALRKHLKPGSAASLRVAKRLGGEAVALGLKAPGLARIHQRALATLKPSSRKKELTQRAEIFLTRATMAFEKVRRDGRAINGHAFRQHGKDQDKGLVESLQLQKRLQHLTHRALAALEDERQKISRKLREEIAQTLLGINIRLLTLKAKAQNNPEGLKKEIANTRRLVIKSVKFVRRFARELRHYQEK